MDLTYRPIHIICNTPTHLHPANTQTKCLFPWHDNPSYFPRLTSPNSASHVLSHSMLQSTRCNEKCVKNAYWGQKQGHHPKKATEAAFGNRLNYCDIVWSQISQSSEHRIRIHLGMIPFCIGININILTLKELRMGYTKMGYSQCLRACSPYGPMKSATVVLQEEANILDMYVWSPMTFFHIGFPLQNEGIGPI